MNIVRFFTVQFLVYFLLVTQLSIATELTKQEIVDLCTTTALKFKEKRETIRTWQGIVEVEVSAYNNSVTEKNPRRQIKAQIEFAIDVVKNRRLSIVTMQTDRNFDTEGNYSSNSCGICGVYIDDETYYRSNRINFDSPETISLLQKQMPGSTHETLIMNHAVSAGHLVIAQKAASETNRASLLDEFDPFVWLLQPKMLKMDNRFLTFASFVNKNPDFHKRFKFEKKGNKFIVSSIYVDELAPELNTFVVDMSKDYSLIMQECKNHKTGKIIIRWEAEYEKQNGILLPQKIERISGRGTSSTKIKVVKSFINLPIPEDKFTLQYLGVRQGDRVYDGRTQTESTVTDTSFPRALSEAELLRPSRSFQWIRYSLIIAGIVMIFCALFFKLRQWTRKTK